MDATPTPPPLSASRCALASLLAREHAALRALFARFAALRHQAGDERRQALVEQACTELVIHAELEQALVYPALRAAGAAADLLDESEVEHIVTRQMVGELEMMLPDDPLYDARFAVLAAWVERHFGIEESRLFPLLETLPEQALLARRLGDRGDELRVEFGLPEHGGEDQPPP